MHQHEVAERLNRSRPAIASPRESGGRGETRMVERANLWGIVFAAGSGERLQPFLRRRGRSHPIKRDCAIVGRRTMLQHTWERTHRCPYLVTGLRRAGFVNGWL